VVNIAYFNCFRGFRSVTVYNVYKLQLYRSRYMPFFQFFKMVAAAIRYS